MSSELRSCFCGNLPTISRHVDRDWCNISCLNANCLRPTTGWGPEAQMVDKWERLIPRREDAAELVEALRACEKAMTMNVETHKYESNPMIMADAIQDARAALAKWGK